MVQTVTKVLTDEGAEGYYFGGHFHGDQDGLLPGDRALIAQFLSPLLAGQDPLRPGRDLATAVGGEASRERLQRHRSGPVGFGRRSRPGCPCTNCWAARATGSRPMPSSFNNLGRPDEYAAHAVECKRQGYRRLQDSSVPLLESRDTPTRVAAAVLRGLGHRGVPRGSGSAVGDEMVLMFDPWGTYHTYADALRVGRELERLGFYWYEHPMPEYGVESYVKLARALDIPICSPEIAEGGIYTRADWILRTHPTSAASTCCAEASPGS